MFLRSFAFVLLWTASAAVLVAAEADPNKVTSAGATDDPATTLKRIRVAPGLKVDLYASEPLIQNVVSFSFDEQGRCFVVESHRRRSSVFDIRGFPEWLDADFAFRTTDDRSNFLRRVIMPENKVIIEKLTKGGRGSLSDVNRDGVLDWRDLEVESERLRVLVDTNRDGRADAASTFAEGFNSLISGVAAGVLARGTNVWFTCIPDLWRISSDELRRTKGLPVSKEPANPRVRSSAFTTSNLLHGFGTHIAFGGHDLHGLTFGPDGKLYFSIADRGTSTNLWHRIVDKWPGLTMEALADSGAVFRCEPDGSQFEVVAIGLRNPQELAFDEFGNLFTGDNNGDGGDKARWIHVVEGADYGWRIGWQWLPKMGGWNSEMLWGMAPSNTSAYYLPPVAHIGAGPSGIAAYPGTGLPVRYDGHFFMCDFRGGPNSVVHSFALRPKGASFEAYDVSEFLSGFLCTDIEFGPDGGVYVSDWVKGWEKSGKGRIWRVNDPALANDAAVLEVQRLLSEGMARRSNEELVKLMGHRDRRLRFAAQEELVLRVDARSLEREAAEEAEIWSREDDERRQARALQRLKPTPFRLLKAALRGTNGFNAQMRAVWAIHEVGRRNWTGRLGLRGIRNSDDLTSKMPDRALAPMLALRSAAESSTAPVAVRTAALRALSQAPRASAGTTLLKHSDPAVRAAALHLHGSQGARLWSDFSPAHRSNYHAQILAAMRLAGSDEPHVRHEAVLALARIGDVPLLLAAAQDTSASVRLGVCLALRRLQRPEVAHFLNDADPQIALEAARAIYDAPVPEALPMLATNVPRNHGAVPEPNASRMLAAHWRRVLNANFRLGTAEAAQRVAALAAGEAPEELRVEALELLALWGKPPGRDRVVGLWRPLPARDGAMAAEALATVLPKLESAPTPVLAAANKAATDLGLRKTSSASNGLADVQRTLEQGSLREKQSAFARLGNSNGAEASRLLLGALDQLLAGKLPRELELDVLEAVQKNAGAAGEAKTKLARFEAARGTNAVAKWRETLYGGNADEGRRVFVERQDAACFRCHKVNGEGGEVGPELAGIGSRQTREQILESILFPNAAIAPGFENVIVELNNGTSYAGVVKSETATELVINSPEDGPVTVLKANVKSRAAGLSGMPEELGNILSRSDLRNLVEFLSTLK